MFCFLIIFEERFYPRTMVLKLGSVRVNVRFELVGETVAAARPRSEQVYTNTQKSIKVPSTKLVFLCGILVL